MTRDEAIHLARVVVDKYGADADKPSVHLAKALLDEAHERDSLRASCEQLKRERDEREAECQRITSEYQGFINHHERVVAQRNKDWDSLMVEIAKAVGTSEDREAAEMGEVDEFDPWHALRTFGERHSALSSTHQAGTK